MIKLWEGLISKYWKLFKELTTEQTNKQTNKRTDWSPRMNVGKGKISDSNTWYGEIKNWVIK